MFKQAIIGFSMLACVVIGLHWLNLARIQYIKNTFPHVIVR